MKTLVLVKDKTVNSVIAKNMAVLGQYAAVGYAQRVVGQRETGTLTPLDAELINAANSEHFLMCFNNLCEAHLARQKKAPPVTIKNATDMGPVVPQAQPQLTQKG